MDSTPGFTAIKETEEVQLWASGPDNQHQRIEAKAKMASATVDSGNTPTTTVRGGNVISLKAAGTTAIYDPDATDGGMVVGVLPKHLNMLDRDGTAEDKFTKVMIGGILKNTSDLLNSNLHALSVLFRRGFRSAALEPHGSMFGLAFKTIDFKNGTTLSGAYTVLAADHGKMLVATTAAMNFTLPTLADVGPGFQVMLYNGVDANMIITAAANTILTGDAGGAPSTTITFSTSNAKMGSHALMVSGYDGEAGALAWFPLMVNRTATIA